MLIPKLPAFLAIMVGLTAGVSRAEPQEVLPKSKTQRIETAVDAGEFVELASHQLESNCGACDRTVGCSSDGTCGNWLSRLDGESPFDSLKNFEIGNGWTASFGGEIRHRLMDEKNRLRPGGPGDSSYDLWRITPHLEIKHGSQFTAYVEAIDASIFNQELPITSIDQNRADLLQYYIDLELAELESGTLRARVGRQVLIYGSQHLVSNLGWSNTFRNFEGVKLYYRGTDWDIDGFWTKPVNGAAGNVFRPTSFDHPDASRDFAGIYSTYKGFENATLDLYWLFLDEDNDKPARIDGERHTFGARYASTNVVKKDCAGDALGTLSFELEGALQTGDSETFLGAANEDIFATMVHTNLGYTFNQMAWKPNIKGIFYWASGDDSPGNGENNNFNTLFPLGHAYWGIIDNLNGSNLLDYSLQASVKPTDKFTFVSAVHWFEKDEAASPIFNVAGAPFTGGAGNKDTDIGVELDLIGTYAITQSLKVQLGYSWFWYGDAVDNAAAPLPRGDARQLYLMTTWAF
jgi:hypothetical protein